MGTRSGDIDPGLHAHLQEQLGWTLDHITDILNNESGLLGLSGLSNDMRKLVGAADAGNERAALAIEVFCYRLAKAIAALFVSLGWVGTVIFTGGIGENASSIRAKVVQQLTLLVLNSIRSATPYTAPALTDASPGTAIGSPWWSLLMKN